MFPQVFQNYILILLMLVLGILPIFNSGYNHPVVYLAGLVLAAGAGIAIAIARWQEPRAPLGPSSHGWSKVPGFGWLMLFVGWTALGLGWSIDRYGTLLALYELFLGVLVFFLAATCLQQQVEKLLKFTLIIGTAVALVGLLFFTFVDTARVQATFVNPNPFGVYVGMLLAVGAFRYLYHPSWWLAAAVIILGDALVLSGSRGSWLAVAAGMAAGWIALSPERRRQAGKALLPLGLGVAAGVVLLTTVAPLIQQQAGTWLEATFWGRWLLSSSIVRPDSLATTSAPGRLSFWGVAWRMAMDHPVGGVGLGNYHTAYFQYWPGDRYYSRFAHNYYVQTAAETGWIGLALLLAFLVSFFWWGWKNRRAAPGVPGLLAACLAFLAHSFVDFSWNIPAVAVLFWAQVGMLAGLVREGETPAILREEAVPVPANHWRWVTRLFPPRGGRRSSLPAWFGIVLAGWLALGAVLGGGGGMLAEQGRDAVVRGDLAEGLRRAQQAVRLVPVAAAYRADVAWVTWVMARQEQDPALQKQAREELEVAVRLSPYNYATSLQLGEMLLAMEDYQQAEVSLKRAAVYGGFMPAPYADLGYLYLQQQRYAEAANILQEGLEMAGLAEINAPTEAERRRISATKVQMHLSLARAYEELGNWPARRAELERALELDPQNAVARRELGKHK